MASLEVRQFAEYLEASVNFLTRQGLQAFRAEALHSERSHHAPIEQSPLQHLPVELPLGSDVAHEPAGEGVACTRRVLNFFDGKRRGTEGMTANAKSSFTKPNRCAILAMLNHQSLRS